MTIVKRFRYTESSDVTTQPTGIALTTGLLLAPGVYNYGGKSYECYEEGLYRFWNPMSDTQQRIVFSGDVELLMSSLAWVTANGTEDELLTTSQKTAQARIGHVRMMCGNTSAWSKAICDSLPNVGFPSVQTRIVRALTSETPNNYYDGHVMIEAKVGGQWQLFDLAGAVAFGDTPMSLKDALPLQSGTLRKQLAKKAFSTKPAEATKFHVAAWVESTLLTPELFNAEWERVLQIPGIVHTDGLTYFYLPTGMEGRQSWVTGLSTSYRVVDKTTWDNMFYPQ